jgi:hypothetical protein
MNILAHQTPASRSSTGRDDLVCRPRRRYTRGVPAWPVRAPIDDPSGGGSFAEEGLARSPANYPQSANKRDGKVRGT